MKLLLSCGNFILPLIQNDCLISIFYAFAKCLFNLTDEVCVIWHNSNLQLMLRLLHCIGSAQSGCTDFYAVANPGPLHIYRTAYSSIYILWSGIFTCFP